MTAPESNDEIAHESLANVVGGCGWTAPSEKARTRGLSRREFLRESGLASVATTGAALTAGCLGDDGEPTAEIGYLPITDAAPLLAASANDHLADHGVDSAEPTLFRGWADLAEAFLAQQVNVAHFLMPMTYWMRYGEPDAPIQVVAWDHTDGSAMTVQPWVTDWTDLGGETVAVPFWYSIHNVILQIALREHGLTPRTDLGRSAVADDEVNLVVTPPPDMPAALDNESIAGYIVAEPFNAIAERETTGRILRFTGDIWRRHACCVVVLHEDVLEDHPEWSTDVLRGIVDAQSWLRSNRSEAAQKLSADGTGLYPQGAPVLEHALTHYGSHEPYLEEGAIAHPEWDLERIGFYPYPYPSYTKELTRRLRDTAVEGDESFFGDLDPNWVADDLVTYEPVETALEEAGGPPAFDLEETNGYEREETIEL